MAGITDRELLILCDLTNLKIEYMQNKMIDPKTNKLTDKNHSLYSLVGSLEGDDNLKGKYDNSFDKLKSNAKALFETHASYKKALEDKETSVIENLKFIEEWEILGLEDSYTLTKTFFTGLYSDLKKLTDDTEQQEVLEGAITNYPTRSDAEDFNTWTERLNLFFGFVDKIETFADVAGVKSPKKILKDKFTSFFSSSETTKDMEVLDKLASQLVKKSSFYIGINDKKELYLVFVEKQFGQELQTASLINNFHYADRGVRISSAAHHKNKKIVISISGMDNLKEEDYLINCIKRGDIPKEALLISNYMSVFQGTYKGYTTIVTGIGLGAILAKISTALFEGDDIHLRAFFSSNPQIFTKMIDFSINKFKMIDSDYPKTGKDSYLQIVGKGSGELIKAEAILVAMKYGWQLISYGFRAFEKAFIPPAIAGSLVASYKFTPVMKVIGWKAFIMAIIWLTIQSISTYIKKKSKIDNYDEFIKHLTSEGILKVDSTYKINRVYLPQKKSYDCSRDIKTDNLLEFLQIASYLIIFDYRRSSSEEFKVYEDFWGKKISKHTQKSLFIESYEKKFGVLSAEDKKKSILYESPRESIIGARFYISQVLIKNIGFYSHVVATMSNSYGKNYSGYEIDKKYEFDYRDLFGVSLYNLLSTIESLQKSFIKNEDKFQGYYAYRDSIQTGVKKKYNYEPKYDYGFEVKKAKNFININYSIRIEDDYYQHTGSDGIYFYFGRLGSNNQVKLGFELSASIIPSIASTAMFALQGDNHKFVAEKGKVDALVPAKQTLVYQNKQDLDNNIQKDTKKKMLEYVKNNESLKADRAVLMEMIEKADLNDAIKIEERGGSVFVAIGHLKKEGGGNNV